MPPLINKTKKQQQGDLLFLSAERRLVAGHDFTESSLVRPGRQRIGAPGIGRPIGRQQRHRTPVLQCTLPHLQEDAHARMQPAFSQHVHRVRRENAPMGRRRGKIQAMPRAGLSNTCVCFWRGTRSSRILCPYYSSEPVMWRRIRGPDRKMKRIVRTAGWGSHI